MSANNREEVVAQAVAAGYPLDEMKKLTVQSIQALLKSKGVRNAVAVAAPAVSEEPIAANEDTATVVDIEFSKAPNTSDAKFKRMQQLHHLKQKLLKGIAANSEALTAYRSLLEEDDVLFLKAEVEHAQNQLSLVLIEMEDIWQWFLEVKKQRKDLYEELTQRTVDFTGKLKNRFMDKVEKLDSYMLSLRQSMGDRSA